MVCVWCGVGGSVWGVLEEASSDDVMCLFPGLMWRVLVWAMDAGFWRVTVSLELPSIMLHIWYISLVLCTAWHL